MPLETPILWPFDASPDEVESRSELDEHLRAGSLAGLTIQGVRLDEEPPNLTDVDLTNTFFVGCRLPSDEFEIELVRRGAHVVPIFDDVPYPTSPSGLYTPEDLAAGYLDGGFESMYDTIVHQHFLKHGGPVPDVREALAQRIHDASVDDALVDAVTAWVAARGPASIVGIMGGHAEPRGSRAYRLAATLTRELARADRLVLTGGGPGVMEAANLGAYLSQRPADELTAAIDRLAAAPDFHDHDRYTAAALAVRDACPPPAAVGGLVGQLTLGGLAIPTWLYGHEPANLFAGGIAKYFSNAIREDTILRLARGGIVFAPGRAGTVQEVFQAATKAFYITDGDGGPMIFLDVDYWTNQLPVQALLRPLLATSPLGDLSGLIHLTDDISEAVALLTGA